MTADNPGMPPILTPRALVTAATTAALCLLPAFSAPALAAAHHRSHAPHKTHHRVKGAKQGGDSSPTRTTGNPNHPTSEALTQETASAAALKSAAPLILNGADQASVTGCSSVAGPGYNCGLQLHAADSASVCNWSVVVQEVRGAPAVVSYSRIDCTH